MDAALVAARFTSEPAVNRAAILALSTALCAAPIAVFAPLVVVTLWMGIYPSSFTVFWDASVRAMVANHLAALEATTKLAGVLAP